MKKRTINGLGIIFAVIAAVIMIVVKYNASTDDSFLMRIGSGLLCLLCVFFGAGLLALVFCLATYGACQILDNIYNKESEKGQKIKDLVSGIWDYFDCYMLVFFIILYILAILNKSITIIPYIW